MTIGSCSFESCMQVIVVCSYFIHERQSPLHAMDSI